jgi:hypothetical protein
MCNYFSGATGGATKSSSHSALHAGRVTGWLPVACCKVSIIACSTFHRLRHARGFRYTYLEPSTCRNAVLQFIWNLWCDPLGHTTSKVGIGDMGSPHTSHSYCGPSLHMWEPLPNLCPIGPIMYWNQLGPMGLGKVLTEVSHLLPGFLLCRIKKPCLWIEMIMSLHLFFVGTLSLFNWCFAMQVHHRRLLPRTSTADLLLTSEWSGGLFSQTTTLMWINRFLYIIGHISCSTKYYTEQCLGTILYEVQGAPSDIWLPIFFPLEKI